MIQLAVIRYLQGRNRPNQADRQMIVIVTVWTPRCEADLHVKRYQSGEQVSATACLTRDGVRERLVRTAGDSTMHSLRFSVLFLAIGLACCSQEVTHTDQERTCIAQRYPDYDAKRLSQCVDACKACMKGNTVTCNTSCRLRGAS